jgi:NADPH2:quinone reductase
MPWIRAHGHRRRRGAGSSQARAAFRSGNKEGEAVRAVVLSEFGPPGNLVAAEVPDPAPGPAQVLVDVDLASITFVETQVRAGRPPNPAMLPKLPAILGNGVGDRGIEVIRGAPAGPAQMRELSTEALARAAAGQLKPLVGQTFPLDRAAEAHAAIEARATIGKTLLRTRAAAVR